MTLLRRDVGSGMRLLAEADPGLRKMKDVARILGFTDKPSSTQDFAAHLAFAGTEDGRFATKMIDDALAGLSPSEKSATLKEALAVADDHGKVPEQRAVIALRHMKRALRYEDKVNRVAPHPEDDAFMDTDVTIEEIIERASLLTLAPGITSAANCEALMMAYAFLLHPLTSGAGGDAARAGLVRMFMPIAIRFAEKGKHADGRAVVGRDRFLDAIRRFAGLQHRDPLVTFGHHWHESSFARLEISHKLAAALCLTDVPTDVEVRAPWLAWSLVVPDGLLQSQECVIRRVWLIGTEPVELVDYRGEVSLFEMTHDHMNPGKEPSAFRRALTNLIRGACLALSNPDDFRKENQHGPTARASHKSNRSGPPDLQQARFLLSAPVKVDLREHLAASLSGRKGASPTVQFLVRGHWRNQAYGPKASLRKTIWIQPFWKGPEESRVLLRQHRVEG